jgi:hypothetical protein
MDSWFSTAKIVLTEVAKTGAIRERPESAENEPDYEEAEDQDKRGKIQGAAAESHRRKSGTQRPEQRLQRFVDCAVDAADRMVPRQPPVPDYPAEDHPRQDHPVRKAEDVADCSHATRSAFAVGGVEA